jgi:hypothetical protein
VPGTLLGEQEPPLVAQDCPFDPPDTAFGEVECPFVSLYGHSYAPNGMGDGPNEQWLLPVTGPNEKK